MNMINRFVAIDVETTGLEKDAHIIEIGLVSVNNGKIVDSWQTFVKPPIAIPREVTHLTGITNKMVANAPSWADIQEELLSYLKDQIIVAHNHSFDQARIEFELGYSLSNQWLDTHDLAKLFLPTLSSYKLISIAQHLNIPDNNHHRALNDAAVCAAVAVRLMKFANQIDPFTISEMGQLFPPDSGTISQFLSSLKSYPQSSSSLEFDNEENSDDEETDSKTPKLSFSEASHFFDSDGLLSKHFKTFESRPQQKEMLETICQSFLEEKHCIIEAGTGTGKSFAYLVPALLWSWQHKTCVVISTATITLQEQLFFQDIPFLSKVLGYPFRATITKGRNNYLCKRRFYNILRQSQNLSVNERLFYGSLINWQSKDFTGDRERLNLNNMENQFWTNICATSDTCMGKKCSHYHDCYFFTNRKKAEKSDLIIINHSLLLQNARLDGAVLPNYQHIIIDEAHHLEQEAGRQFTDVLDLELIRKNFASINRSTGLLSRIQKQLAESVSLAFEQSEIEAIIMKNRTDADEVAHLLKLLIDMSCKINALEAVAERRITEKVRTSDWWLELLEPLNGMFNYLTSATKNLQRLLNRIHNDEVMEDTARELSFTIDLLVENIDILSRFIDGKDETFVYWAKALKAGWGNNLLLYIARIEVMPIIREKLFEKHESVILTSATLAINHHLDYTAEKFLLTKNEYRSYICDSPFDVMNQSMIAIPTDHPDYSKTSDFAYAQMVANDLYQLIPAVDGDMLILFTSYTMLNRVYFMLKKNRLLSEYHILGHGQDGTRSNIIATMQKEKKTVVLGTASFWEGVDVPGTNLRTVVIVKLPFAPPSQPLESARAERLESIGKNAFNHLSLPNAILRFRQGCGRLLRTKQDWGAIIILDQRILTKPYGKQFIESLPKQPILKEDLSTICNNLRIFMKEKSLIIDQS